MKESRTGPRMLPLAFECDGCEFEKSEYYTAQSDSGFDYWCVHTDVGGHREKPDNDTPSWCPLLPKRRAIGTCADCVHCTRADPSMYAGNMGKCDSKYHADGDVVFGAEYGCIHWEAKP